MILPIYLYFLFPCIIVGISVYFQKSAPLYLKLLPILLTINLIAEIVGMWLAQQYGTNVAMFNFYTSFELTFYLFLLRDMVVGKTIRLILLHLLWLYPLYCVINIVFIQGMEGWHSYSYGIGNLLIVGVSMYYFFELFKRPKAINLLTEPAFWICSGLLFFYSCSFPFLGPMNVLSVAPTVVIRNFHTIIALLNIFHYVLFTIAFLCRINFKKPFSSKIAQSPQ